MMSKGWDEVGYLREASAAIKETYKDTAKVEELMQIIDKLENEVINLSTKKEKNKRKLKQNKIFLGGLV